jgi:hypothetical protein
VCSPKSSKDYTATLLRAILDNQTYNGLSEFNNTLEKILINSGDLAVFAERYERYRQKEEETSMASGRG